MVMVMVMVRVRVRVIVLVRVRVRYVDDGILNTHGLKLWVYWSLINESRSRIQTRANTYRIVTCMRSCRYDTPGPR